MNKNNYSRPFLDKLEWLILTGVSPECIYQETLEYLDDYDKEMSKLKQQRDELLAAFKQAVDCGMVPTSSAKDGGANRHIKQLQVADMIRDAIKNAECE